MRKILFLPLYNEDWASSKYRVYKHIPYLENLGLHCTVLRSPQPAFLPRLYYYSRLFWGCLTHHTVFIQKKIFRRPLFWLIRLTAKRVLFDFDDAIYCYEKDLKEIQYILSNADHILVADESLAAYARRHNRHVTVLPTPLEAGHFSDHRSGRDERVKIAWIGRPGNQHYLAGLDGVFEKLKEFRFKLILYVVSGEPFRFPNTDFPVIHIPWSEEAEEQILHTADIGIVPLTDDEWSRGKCGYKVLLFMSHGIPVIASPVGVKATLIKNGTNGFLAANEEEWIEKILLLTEDAGMRRRLGAAGYNTFADGYTYEAVSSRLSAILKAEPGHEDGRY